jgi:acid phosphatase
MSTFQRIPAWSGVAFAVAAAMSTGCGAPRIARLQDSAANTSAAPPAFQQVDLPYRGLDSNLWMQTSAEYRACCLQAYNLATERLREAVEVNPAGPRAVIMDLDETVIDNAGYMAMILRSGLAFDARLWEIWERDHADMVGLIPGAKEFILEASRLGVTVIYISNRSHGSHAQAKTILARHGIPVADDANIKLLTNSSDKTGRRDDVAREYTVLLLVGDNLRDFDEVFRYAAPQQLSDESIQLAIDARKDAVDQHREEWGDKWIILPNPSYGEWTKALGQGEADLDRLVPEHGN